MDNYSSEKENDYNDELVETLVGEENDENREKSDELVENTYLEDDHEMEIQSDHDETNTTRSKEDESEVSDEVRTEISEKSSYSPEVNSYINSVEQLEIYQNAGLEEVEINGRVCLIKNDIDMDQVDEFGMTNAELIKEGYAPYDTEGRKIELHHIGQKDNAPLAELKFEEHRSSDTYSILHDTQKESEVNRTKFNSERESHWKSRSEYYNKGGTFT